jgi:hypothetical protein
LNPRRVEQRDAAAMCERRSVTVVLLSFFAQEKLIGGIASVGLKG